MHIWSSVKTSLSLLSPRDRRILWFVTALQFLLSLLDLVGVLLLGTVAALATMSVTGTNLGSSGLGLLIDSLPDSNGFVFFLAGLAAVFLIAKSLLTLLLTRKIFRFLANRQAMVAGNLAQRLLNRPLLEVQSRSSQEISIALTSGVSALTINTLGQAVVVVAEISLTVALVIGLLFVDPIVAIFSVCFFGLLVVVLQLLMGSWATSLGNRFMIADIRSYAAMQHALRAYREISVSGRRQMFIDKFRKARWEAARIQSDTYIVNQIGKYVFEIGLIIGGGILIAIVAVTNNLTAGIAIITVFLAASARIFPSLLRLQGALISIRGAEGASEVTLRLISELDSAKPTVDSHSNLTAQQVAKQTELTYRGYPGFQPSIAIENVTLAYPGVSKKSLDGISISITANQSVAIVGTSGAGKSTLADVILGVLIPTSGQVLISGKDPHQAISTWPGAITYVPQDVAILSGSIRENVALGIIDDEIDDKLVLEALERAHLSDFLLESRQGLETLVGENGVQLSGGQRQRLGIARALYSRPRLLVLDEATSALDSNTETLITDTLSEISSSTTVIVIAHRLASVRNFDQVVYLDDGRISGVGTFEEVRNQVPNLDRQAKLLGL